MRKEVLAPFYASVRFLIMPVHHIPKRLEATQKELMELCRLAVNGDGVDVIVLVCTGFSHEVDLRPIMKEVEVPVLDPFVIAVRTAQLSVKSGLSHSKVAYPIYPRKGVTESPSVTGAFDDVLEE